jgi:hypothetical protein
MRKRTVVPTTNNNVKQEYKDSLLTSEKDSQRTFGDFHEEFTGKICKIQVPNQLIIGLVKETRAYWIKVETTEKRTLYINKAFVISVEPIAKT